MQKKLNAEEAVRSAGPWGDQHGSHWDDGVHTAIRKVNLTYGSSICSIKIEYDDNNRSFWSRVHGQEVVTRVDQISIDYPNEFLTSINGYYGSRGVLSLTFVTNLRTYGPYGKKMGTYFTSPATVGMIVGFHGKVSHYLSCAIGVHIKPMQDINLQFQSHSIQIHRNVRVRRTPKKGIFTPTFTAVEEYQNPRLRFRDKDVKASPKAESRVASHGPWGGPGGSMFDDGYYTGIRQVNLSHDDEAIRTIKVCYDKDGKLVWRNTHGDGGGDKFNKVIFDYPDERLKRITGTYGPVMDSGPVVIRSISFHTTNRRKHGPFGVETGSPFTSNVDVKKSERIVGFYGRESLYLEAIGVHVHVGQAGSSDLSDEKPEEEDQGTIQPIERDNNHLNSIRNIYYRSFKITNFWGYH